MATTKPDVNIIWALSASPADKVDPGDAKVLSGWDPNEIPPASTFNFEQNKVALFAAHVNERGIPMHDDITNYPVHARVQAANGIIYKSLQNPNIAQNPITEVLFWKKANGDAFVADPLSQFAETTSDQLRSVISDETGTGLLVFGTSPTLETPDLGVPSALDLENASGLPPEGVVGTAAVLAANIFTGLQTFKAGADIAATAAVDLTAATGNTVVITGSTTSTSFVMDTGQQMILLPSAGWPLTYNATTMKIQGNADYTCQAGDVLFVVKDLAGVIRVTVSKRDGTPIVSSGQVRNLFDKSLFRGN